MNQEKNIRRALWVLILVSFAVRAIIAGMIEFGNDEVYYWTYARFPDWSHFDHPPMVGWVIQLFTLNLHLEHEFFIRLGAVIFGTINTYLIFLIGKNIKNSLTGLYAAFLYTASIYCTILSGIFILPDSPQVMFWLMSLLLLLKALPDKGLTGSSRKMILAAGLTLGLAMLSKYHSVFLIFGAFLYILFFNRRWLRAKETYLAILIVILLFLPVIIWNKNNAFVSFAFHESRIEHVKPGIRWDYFLAEVSGEFFYNNPVSVIILLFAFVALFRGKRFLAKDPLAILLFTSVPLALVFIAVSLFRSTLPHWTGPAYLGFILLSASFLEGEQERKKSGKIFPVPIGISLLLIILLLVLGVGQINFGIVNFRKMKSEDFSAQLYGWKQLGEKAAKIMEEDANSGKIPPGSPILTYRWFPAANLDYYVARPAGRNVYAIGTLERIHKYYWINSRNGDLQKGTDAYYIGLSDDFNDPLQLYGKLFDSISSPDTIRIFRRNEQIREAYLYRLIGLKRTIAFSQNGRYSGMNRDQILHWEQQIRADKQWMDLVRKKASGNGISIEQQLREEATFMADQEIN